MTKQFVEAASFILSAEVGSDKKTNKVKKRSEYPLWNPKSFEEKQWFSQTTYLQVKEIAGNKITVKNAFGNYLHVSKDILEGMYSASHFDKVVPVNMTTLAELLHTVQDHVFEVMFRKQPTEENALSLIQRVDQSALRNDSMLRLMSKELISGQTVQMTCHMVKVENNLGRSLVIDLNGKGPN